MDLQSSFDSLKGLVKFGDVPTLLTYNITAKSTYSATVIVGDNNLGMGELNFRFSEKVLKKREIQKLHYPKV